MSNSSGDGLNRAQRTAVTTLSGPLLVLAGAGTGKTRVITFRIAELIRSGITPSRILAVTFTNKAAREMRERAGKLLGKRRKKKQKGPEISTFHSLCVRILRRNARALGYPDNFTIYDRGDQESVARAALRDIRVGSQKLRPGDLINLISGWKSASLSPNAAQHAAIDDREVLAAQAYEKYQKSLKMSGAMDFDDLLTQTEILLSQHPEVRFAESSRFDHLLIDEYQDTSGIQYRIVRALAERHRNICVVGDDDQSIYGWRGAEVTHILGFKEQWTDAKVVRLEENYRSTGWILHIANTLIAHNSLRHDKVLKPARGPGDPPRFVPYEDENHEAEAVVSEIFRKINREDEERVPASNIAILFRTNEQPRAFEQEMRRSGVPYRLVGGQSFYDRKEIKDLLSYLRIVANPNDEVSLLRVINTPPRGIGPSSVGVLLDEAVSQGVPLWRLLETATTHPDVAFAAAQAIEQFRRLIDEFRARMANETLSSLVVDLIARVNYKAELERQYKDPSEQETRWNAVQELVNAVATYEARDDSPSLLGFLEESSLSDREEDKDEDDRKEHAVTLMTLHSAKGLEFPEVYLVGMEEGLLPHKRSVLEETDTIPEERRLAYVGVTRAQEKLTLSFCKNRMKWGKLRPQIPSRFLMEMRGETEKAQALAAQATVQIAADYEKVREIEEKKNSKNKKKGRSKKSVTKPGGEQPEAKAARIPKTSKTEKPRVSEVRAAQVDPIDREKVPAKSEPRPSPTPREHATLPITAKDRELNRPEPSLYIPEPSTRTTPPQTPVVEHSPAATPTPAATPVAERAQAMAPVVEHSPAAMRVAGQVPAATVPTSPASAEPTAKKEQARTPGRNKPAPRYQQVSLFGDDY